ncbi:MAG: pyridoxal 5'-phosphate synthase glutaminase subunit PdxT [Clostridia bacterium]|nr:pyridoxal 5'-phosphate synthase glutaminase subunit PdxT [Clostridia bacterium]
MRIGVLSYQGAVSEHIDMVRSLGVEAVPVRDAATLADVDGLILPGGESTTHGKLLTQFGLDRSIRAAAECGMPVFGTCTGLILLAREIVGSAQPRLGLMDISVERNAFGRQVDSFEVDLNVEGMGEPFPGVFIRAPIIRQVASEVSVLARFGGEPVFVRQAHLLGCAFHPELTSDARIHALFVEMASDYRAHNAEKRG